MKKHVDAQGNTITAYTAEELASLPRLHGADREMTDEEITAAARADEDTAPPLLTTSEGFSGKRVQLSGIFPAETVEELTKRGRGRPKADNPKVQFTVRFDADIVEHFRKGGRGWQVRMEETLRKAIAAGL